MYCNNDNSMSIYILNELYNKFFDLFKYMDVIINFKEMNPTAFNRFKEIIYLIGKDIKTIFKSAVNTIIEFADFKFSIVLTNMFNEFLIQEKNFEGVEKKHEALIAERKIFENYIKNVGMIEFINNLRKWATDSSDDIMEAKIIKNIKTIKIIKMIMIIILKSSDVLKLNIEDLVMYINDPKAKTNHKKS